MTPIEQNNYEESQLEVVDKNKLTQQDFNDIENINNYLNKNLDINKSEGVDHFNSMDSKAISPTQRKAKESYDRLKSKIDNKLLKFVSDQKSIITSNLYKKSENISKINLDNKLEDGEKIRSIQDYFNNISDISSKLWINHRDMNGSSINNIQKNIKNGYNKLHSYRRDQIYNEMDSYKNNSNFRRRVSKVELQLKMTLYKLNDYGIAGNIQNRLRSGGNFQNDINMIKGMLLDSTKELIDNRNISKYNNVYGEGAIKIVSMLKNMRNSLINNMDNTIKILKDKERIKLRNYKKSPQVETKTVEEINLKEADQKRGMLKNLSEENKRVVSEYVKDNNSKIKTYTISGLADGIKFIPGGPGEKNVDNNYSKLKDWIKENKINVPDIPETEKNNPNYKLARNRAVKFLYDLDTDTRNEIVNKGISWDIGTTDKKDQKGTYRLGSIKAKFVDSNSIESQEKTIPKYLNFIDFDIHPQDPAATAYGNTAKYSVFIGGDEGTGWNYIGNKFNYPNGASKETQNKWLEGDLQTDVDYLLLKIFSGKENPNTYKINQQPHTLVGFHGGMQQYENKIRNKVDSVVKNIREGKYKSIAVLESIFERNGIDSTGYDYGYLKIKGEPK